MPVSTGKRKRTCVKVFHINISEVENEVNKWIKDNDGVAEIIDIKLSNDSQSKAVVMIIYKIMRCDQLQ